MPQDSKTFLGNGLSFPIRMNARGEISLVTGSEDINQSIRIILGTRPGERVMRPTFGCRAYELIYEPINAATYSQLQEFIYEALQMWEPRIELRNVAVSVDSGNGSALLAEIEYEIKATHDVRSIVYPFYIEPEEEVM
ncbi:MAG: GPW/gp25 family protein [Anaerolineae bacterium]|nr:GPW/gp25 family protein [Anaerolineae bacterium]